MPDLGLPDVAEQNSTTACDRGVAARRAGRRDEAVAWFRRALGVAPADPRARLELATTLREQRRPDEAEPFYRALLADDPASWEAMVGLGLCARMRRDLAASAEHLAAALALAPGERSVRLEYATTLREAGQVRQAEPIYRALLADDPASWQAMVGLGLCARTRRDLEASAQHLAAALALAPRERSARLEYAATLRDQRRLDEAEAAYRALLADEPRAWQAMLGLGLCARMRRTLPVAAEHFAAALALAPRERPVRLEHAATLRELRRLDEAEAAYRALLADEPAAWQALAGLGLCARLRNDRAGALAHLTAATEAAPDAEGPWLGLAGELRDAGRFEAARAILRRLLDRGQSGAAAWLGLGQIERTAGDRTAALAAFLEGYRRHPEQHQLMVEIGLEERALGRFAQAEQWLLRAAGSAALAGQALLHLAEMARVRRQMETALELLRRAAALPAAPAGVPGMMAQTLADIGRLDEALGVLDAAERRTGGSPDIALKRVVLLRRAGFRHEAIAIARQAVAATPTHFPLWVEWFEAERCSGDVAGIDRILAAAPAGTVHEQARLQTARGQLAAQRWQPDAAAEAFGAALALDPATPGAHDALVRTHLLRCDIPAARDHLQRMAQQRASSQVEQGLSPHATHSHIGNLFDEYAMDRTALAALVEARALAPAERIARLLALTRAAPDHTPTAIALLVALRQSGHLAGPWRGPGGPGIPATVAQYWDEAAPPDDVAALMRSWPERNPSRRHCVFDHAAARAFLAARCSPEVLHAYLRAREPAMRADLFRLAWLFAEGGCYADADDRCLRPIDELLPPGVGLVGFQEEYGTLGNNFLAAAPLHPVIGLALELAVQAIDRGDDDMMWLATGPGLMTRAVARTLAMSSLRPAVWLERTRILDRHELECVVATHCAVGYKLTRRHWLRAAFGRPGASPPAAEGRGA
jgi:tetratricopeptide (TPR) repeat protein